MTADETNDRYVVLSDVVGSRGIDDRERFESGLKTAFETANRSYDQSLVVPFSQMKGIDEFGCVLADISALPPVISTLLNHTHPVGVRFGVASGAIDVGVNETSVAEMDGPAFHRASEILERLKNDGLYVGLDTGQRYDDLASAALNLLVLHELSLSRRQVETILAYESHGTQSDAAAHLEVSQQAVSDALQKADYYRIETLLNYIANSFETIYGS